MSAYNFTPEAVNDLGEIYSYVAHEDMVAAGQLLERLTRLFRKLSTVQALRIVIMD
jgi:plasmid stabilization system protein ParE